MKNYPWSLLDGLFKKRIFSDFSGSSAIVTRWQNVKHIKQNIKKIKGKKKVGIMAVTWNFENDMTAPWDHPVNCWHVASSHSWRSHAWSPPVTAILVTALVNLTNYAPVNLCKCVFLDISKIFCKYVYINNFFLFKKVSFQKWVIEIFNSIYKNKRKMILWQLN